jgi:nucleoside-triphosphatase THEP1
MSSSEEKKFGYLGRDFQVRLLYQVLTDRKFANSIMEIMDANYFEDEFLRKIAITVKGAYEKHEAVPDMSSLEMRLMDSAKDEIQRDFILKQLRKVKEAETNDALWVQDRALKFCKQQELKKSIKEIQGIVDKGDIDEYDECVDILRKALEVGDGKDDGIDVFHDMDSVLADDFRKPIPTGIKGLDECMDGGLSKGELAVILAPFGVGKTTMVTKIANTAKNEGYNVLQIFFEDNPKVIQRKHLACWSGHNLNDLKYHKDELNEIATKKSAEKGQLKLKKFPSDGTTIPHIKQYITRQISQGFRPDIILVDYIDCIQATKQFKESWDAEGNVMRQFETMLAELDIAGWTAVQGNRSSIGAETVDSTMIGGSIKKGQIGHFIVSIAKTLDQKESGHANIAILKSRFGKDGIIFNDAIFNNGTISIEIVEDNGGKTFMESKREKETNSQLRVNNILDAAKARQKALEEEDGA